MLFKAVIDEVQLGRDDDFDEKEDNSDEEEDAFSFY
jgi:hypothetical protein